jgi:hypothetical protein
MKKLSFLAAALAAATGACGTDESEPDVIDPTPTTFKIRIENIAPWTVLKSAQQATKVDGSGGGAGPGAAFEIRFTAGRNQNISFASMLGQSNDWFFGPGPDGIKLYDADGNPRSGDVTAEVKLWDTGTEIDQEPGVGDATGPHQPSPDFGAPDPIAMVRELGQTVTLTDGSTFTLPAIDSMIKVTLVPGANRQFTLRIENISTGTTLVTSAGSSGVGVSPPVWAVHTRSAPLFDLGVADRGHGLELVAESGRGADLTASLRVLSGAATPISPGVFALHRDPEPLYALGLEDLGLGIEHLAEDGNASPLLAAIGSNAALMRLSATGGFDTPVGADAKGPARPGGAYEIVIEALPGDHLSFATMFGLSNDWVFATRPEGIALFDAAGAPRRGEVTDAVAIFDVGTELDQELAIGADTGPQQSGPNTGAADPIHQFREVPTVAHPFPASAHLRVTLEPQ